MRLRSLLFVPGDRPERFDKAVASGADALILDLEDAVVEEHKAGARANIAAFLAGRSPTPCLVRVNPVDSDFLALDLAALAATAPAGVVLPKAAGAASVVTLFARHGAILSATPVLPIATETAAAVFQLGSYADVANRLLGLTWGAEDLPAAIGARAARHPDGSFTPPFEMVRALALFAAHAAGVPAIETVFPDLDDLDALARYVGHARRDGFGGMLAVHPRQVGVINVGFTPDADEVAQARAVVSAFAAAPGQGALRLAGRMLDRPHLLQARRILSQAGEDAAQ